jgi:hypothetical protein
MVSVVPIETEPTSGAFNLEPNVNRPFCLLRLGTSALETIDRHIPDCSSG